MDLSGFESDEALFDHLARQQELASQVPSLQQLAQYGQALLPYDQQIAELIQSQRSPIQPQPTAAAPAQQEPYWPKPPEWDQAWQQRLGRDPQTGEVTGSPVDLQRYQAYQDWQRNALERLIRDPYEAIAPRLQQDYKSQMEMARRVAREELSAYQQEQAINGFVLDNQAWIYQKGADGRPMIDRQSGQPVFSQDGVAFSQAVSLLERAGANVALIPQLATQMVFGHRDPTAPQAQAAYPAAPPSSTASPSAAPLPSAPLSLPVPPAEATKQQFIAGVIAEANRAGSLAAAAQPGGPAQHLEEDPVEMLRRDFAQAGIRG